MSVSWTRLRLSGAVSAFLAAACVLAAPSTARAQGVTTGAVRGVITEQQGQPIVGAAVVMINNANGQRFTATTGDDGQFFVANVVVGRYALEARAIGFRPARLPQTVSLGRVE